MAEMINMPIQFLMMSNIKKKNKKKNNYKRLNYAKKNMKIQKN